MFGEKRWRKSNWKKKRKISYKNKNIEKNKNRNNNEYTEDIKAIDQKDSKEGKITIQAKSELKNIEKEECPKNFQLFLKLDCNNQYFNNFSFQNIITIKELSKNRIGILLNINSLLIYNSKTFNKISEIKINNSDDISNDNDNENLRIKNMMMLKSKEEIVINFIELKNFNLVFWTFKKNIFL